jgi:fructoselysine-6-P-deglycase FrlB-like protein
MLNEMMAREIAAQPAVLAACIEPLADAAQTIARPNGRIFAGGCGDSAFAPAALGDVFAALGIEIEPRTAMQLSGFTRLKNGDTVVLSSISGSTKRTVEAAFVARDRGARVIALTCNPDSALAKTSDKTIVLPFTPLSRKTPHTLDYTVALVALVQLAMHWQGMSPRSIGEVVGTMEQIVSRSKAEAAEIAGAIDPGGKIIILGAGPDYATAQYGTAKFHEAGGLVAIAAETENFIHGMNFLLEPGDTLLAIASNEVGRRRGIQITEGFVALSIQTAILGQPAASNWQGLLTSVLANTILLQELCFIVAEQLSLAVEQPRGGRNQGDLHADIQRRLMRLD